MAKESVRRLYRIRQGGHFVQPWRIRLVRRPFGVLHYRLFLSFPEGLPDQREPFYSKYGGLDGDLLRPMSNEVLLGMMVYKGVLTAGIYHHPTARWLRTTKVFPRRSKVEVPYAPDTPLDVAMKIAVERRKVSGFIRIDVSGDTTLHPFTEDVNFRPGPVLRLYNAYYGGRPAAPRDIVFTKEELLS